NRQADQEGMEPTRRPRRRNRRPRLVRRPPLPNGRPDRTVPHPLRARPRLPIPAADARTPGKVARRPIPSALREVPPMSNTTVSPSRRGDNARTLNMVRRIGYRILPGETFSYILHLRPSEWPIMAAHTMLGFLLAAGLDPLAAGSSWREAAFGLFVWVVLLNGGTLALNSAFDNDEGDIGYLIAPPPPPRGLAAYSIALMAIGQALAPLLGLGFTLAYAACFVLSILYSLPPFRWKAVAGADWFINMWGFGTLTPLAGWTITGKPLEPWAILVLLAFCPLFAAFYPLTQLYQFEEDTRRGDRTL